MDALLRPEYAGLFAPVEPDRFFAPLEGLSLEDEEAMLLIDTAQYLPGDILTKVDRETVALAPRFC